MHYRRIRGTRASGLQWAQEQIMTGNNHPNRGKTNYALERCDETSPHHTGKGRSYIVTFRGQMIGHLDIHESGYRDWSFNAEAGSPPSRRTQDRLVKSVRNDR